MTDNQLSNLKQSYRQSMRERRQAISSDEQVLASQKLAQQYQQHFKSLQSTNIAIYLTNDGELDTGHLIETLFNVGHSLYVPKISTSQPGEMKFCRLKSDREFITNRFGIKEPLINEFIDIVEIEIIFLPLTAFDINGNRLGMGGGFYDRVLSKEHHPSLKSIGLAYDFQEIEHCPVQSFDQPLNNLLTPTRMLEFKL
jgi:5-formyltetrahydrofolate cyclo-ligase